MSRAGTVRNNRAIVVGSGPNGLAGAIALAQAGMEVTVLEGHDEIGGGTRTAELTLPGLLHDVCSAVHPFGYASPFLQSLGLEQHGLQWAWPTVDLAHPLDGGPPGVMVQDIDETADGLGVDGAAWRRTFGPLVDRFDDLLAEMFQPIVHVPRHPVPMVRYGIGALQSTTLFAWRWRTDQARALFAGIAAHLVQPLTRPTSASVGIMMAAAGHRSVVPVRSRTRWPRSCASTAARSRRATTWPRSPSCPRLRSCCSTSRPAPSCEWRVTG